jgi:glycosyltransferase involved in cell wall biosynthesis
MISIIIPTLNEEDYLPLTLDSIKKQDMKDYEIIVSDAGSSDTTLQIAKDYHSIIVEGGLPAKGRNNGAKVAKGDMLFFLDADTILPSQFFKKALAEFNERKLGVASFCLTPYPSNKLSSFWLEVFYNKPIIILEKIWPHSAMAILIKKDVFNALHGYDQTITLAEDMDLSRRAVAYTRFGIIKSVRVAFSDRRFKKEGFLVIGVKFFLCELYNIFIGPVRSDIFKYKFNHYKDKT